MPKDTYKPTYTPNESRVVDYLEVILNSVEGKGWVGAGEDPIGFLIASHMTIRQDVIALRKENAQLKFILGPRSNFPPEPIPCPSKKGA